MIFSGVLFARVGGILGLYFMGLPFTISAGVGFVALAGASILEVEATDVGSLLDLLSGTYGPAFDRIMSVGTVVMDGQTVGRDRALEPGDEVALLPPVSGGSDVR